jgi:hypothetical protein
MARMLLGELRSSFYKGRFTKVSKCLRAAGVPSLARYMPAWRLKIKSADPGWR